MNRAAIVAIVAIAIVLGGALATTAYAAHSVYNAGSLQVQVTEHRPGGAEINIWAPAVLIDVVTPFAPLAVPHEARGEMARWLPLASAATEELLRTPDCVFVEVISSREQVRISKRGDQLLIDVTDEHESVHVSLPLRSVAKLMNRFERLS